MIELPHIAGFAATLHEPRFAAAVAVALLAGMVRGFAGFGSGLVYVPLAAAFYAPVIATVSSVLMDFVCAVPFVLRAVGEARWREVLPALAAAMVTVSLGTMAQQAVDPVVLRWGMAIFVLAFVVLLAAGWRYPFKPSVPAAIGAGALSGITGGAAQLGGPPVILYWLGSPSASAIVRANLIVFLSLLEFMLIVDYAWHGLITAKPVSLAVLLWPVYIVAFAVGARWFRGASDVTYRRVAYVIVALAALVSMPAFDGVLH